jgi:hypothetical protein
MGSLLVTMVAGIVPAWSEERVGVVTAVVGSVTLARGSMPLQTVKFKDDVFVNDRITTGEDAITRVLLGDKVIITARERSTLTITEVPGLSTIDLTSGRIAVAVDKTRMKPGERVDVRTSNAIAGVRGTVLVVEALGDTSTVTVLRGLVDVARRDLLTGQPVGPITPVAALQAVSVRSDVLPAQARTIPPSRSQELSGEFTPPLKLVLSRDVVPVAEEIDRAAELLRTTLSMPAVRLETPATPGAGGREGREGNNGNGGKEGKESVSMSTPVAMPTLTPTTPSVKAKAQKLVVSPPRMSSEKRSDK